MPLTLTRLTLISGKTSEANARMVVHTVHARTTNGITSMIHTVVDVCK